MASMQCYRSCHETCETKCHDNSFGHNQHSSQGQCFGQTQQPCYPDHSKTHKPHCATNTHSHHGIMGHAQSLTHGGHHMGHNSSSSSDGVASCHGKTHEKKNNNKCGGGEYKKKKEKSHCKTKQRDGNRSCSDGSSDSDSD